MNYIGINSSGGGSDKGVSGNGITESTYTLEISKLLKDKLSNYDVNVILIRENDSTIDYENRIKFIKSSIPSKSVIISNTLSNNDLFEVIYQLNKDDSLASLIASNLSKVYNTNYYQLRWPTNTLKDYYYISRETTDYNTIIIRLGNPNNTTIAKILKNNKNEIVDAIAFSLIKFLNLKEKSVDVNTYKVVSGDTLYSIAKKFNTTVDKLKDINNLNSNLINVNQELIIPNKTYKVLSGDTLYSIAKKFNTTVDKLKDINNLNSNLIKINSILYIP